jgi:hypothetical protein
VLTFLILVSLVMVAILGLTAVAFVGFLIKALLWAVFFPVRLILKLVFGTLGVVFGVLLVPIVAIVAGLAIAGALIAALVAIVAPLIPFVLLALVVWAIYKASTRRAPAQVI